LIMGGQFPLPMEVLMTVAQHAESLHDLVALCSVCRFTLSASCLLVSHWLRSRDLGSSSEVSEPHALGFLRRHIHGKPTNYAHHEL
jgi:hypothetical protein